ncbi:MAG: hypothetical protein GW913_11760 [Myxococcales bacterium]|nr:hypothetical protein [Myxococcales bacterium]
MTALRAALCAPFVLALACGGGAAATRPTRAGASAEALVGGGPDGRSFQVAARAFHLTADGDAEFPDGRDTALSDVGQGPWDILRAQAADVTGDGVADAVFLLRRAPDSAEAVFVVDAANGRVQGVITARERRVANPGHPERFDEISTTRCGSELPALPWTQPFRLACCSCSRVCHWDAYEPDPTRDCQSTADRQAYSFAPPGARTPLASSEDAEASPTCSCE